MGSKNDIELGILPLFFKHHFNESKELKILNEEEFTTN